MQERFYNNKYSFSFFSFFLLVTSYFCTVQTVSAQEDYTGTITVVVGQTRIIPYRGVSKVSIGHADIANASQTAPNEILVTGLKVGETDFRIWTSGKAEVRYLLKVIDKSWEQTLKVSKLILENVEGVSARAENGIVFIEGRVLRNYDLGIINELKSRFQKEVSSGTMIFNVAAPSVNLKAMVMLDVKVVEIRRNVVKKLGIDWADSTGGPTAAVTGIFRGAGNFEVGESIVSLGTEEGLNIVNFSQSNSLNPLTSISSTINILENNGAAKTLAEPKLITRSGATAEFLGGGEIPIPVTGKDGDINVTFKQVGVILNIEPVADPDGYIATKLEVEVSAVDSSVSVLGIPGFRTRRAVSEMNMLSGQTMVVAGMLNTEDSKALQKVPGLGSIPIIGELFKSRDFNKNITELVVFVTPHLIDPESDRNKGMIQRSEDMLSEVDKEIEFSIFD